MMLKMKALNNLGIMFCETEVVGCIDDVEGKALNNSVIVFCETTVVGCTDDVEGEGLKNEVTVLLVTDVICGIADIGALEFSIPGSDGL